MCKNCAEAYTTGLRRLLSDRYPDPGQAGTLGRQFVNLNNNTTAIFWADVGAGSLSILASIFDSPNEDSVKSLFESPQQGAPGAVIEDRFFCLLISGGQGRAILRGVHTGTLAEVEEHVRNYFQVLRPYGERPLPLFALLRSLAVLGKPENLPPQLAGETFLSILFGLPFARTLLSTAVLRSRAEQQVTRERAAVLALFFSRISKERELIMSLNTESIDPGYRLGRLLAVLERLQSEAVRNVNKTLVDRYYGAASTRPRTVFPSLIHLAQHHAAKLSRPGYFQKQLGEVLDGLSEFPPALSLSEQGKFALGYYHQRQDYFKKREVEPADSETSTDERSNA